MANEPQFGLMGLSNFQIQRLGLAWANMICPRPIVGQTPKIALLRPLAWAWPKLIPNVFCRTSKNVTYVLNFEKNKVMKIVI